MPRWRLGLMPPLPQFWIASPWRNSCPWNRLSPVMIRLEIPAQVMLAVEARRVGGVGPAPVVLLAAFPVGPGQGPDLGLDRHADLGGGVQAEEGVLRVRVVAGLGPLRARIGPGARPVDRIARLDLGPLEPVHVGEDPVEVALGLGGGEDHRLERDRIGAVELLGREVPEQVERLAHGRRVGLLARGEQGQGHEAGGAGPGLAVDVDPGPVGPLLILEVADALADRPLDFLTRHRGGRGGRAEKMR